MTIATLGTSSAKLERGEEDPVGRMCIDSERVSVVMAARNGHVLGEPGAQDEWWWRRYEAERRRGEAGEATRYGGLGCPACQVCRCDMPDVCDGCNGWARRGKRGRVLYCEHIGCIDRRECAECGGGVADAPTNARHVTPTVRRAAHAVRADGSAGRMLRDGGWVAGSTGKRRLGTCDAGAEGTRWVGFAGLARTVVERLVEHGSTHDEDCDAAVPLADVRADVQHVLGGECHAVSAEPLLMSVRYLACVVRRCGGVGSALHDLVDRAERHLIAMPLARPRDADATDGWHALKQLIACDAPRPEWQRVGGMTASEEQSATSVFDKQIKDAWREMLTAAASFKGEWAQAATAGLDGHRRREASRGLLRVILRAWREATDDVRNGAAKWEARWADASETVSELEPARPCACGYVSRSRARLWQHMRVLRQVARWAWCRRAHDAMRWSWYI